MWFKLFTAIALPALVFVGGVTLMSLLTHNANVQQITNLKPLNKRAAGYSSSDVIHFWNAINESKELNLRNERKLLKIDLVFPVLYTSAFFIALWLLWGLSGQPFAITYVVILLAGILLADWMENCLQLHQINAYIGSIDASRSVELVINNNLLAVASIATRVKLWGIVAALFMFAFLFVGALKQEYVQ